MKKLFVFFLLMAYGLTSTGMTLHIHYCCGKVDKIELESRVEKNCAQMHHSKSCCDSREINLKIQSEQNITSFLQPSFSALLPLQPHHELMTDELVATSTFVPAIFTPPPLQKNLQRFLCIFRI
jgi:hypothetical protein